MTALFKALGFSIALILVFASVTYVLPQVRGEAPEEEEVNLGELTMDDFVAMGEKLYRGKGTCTLCHNNLGRAPDLLTYNVVSVSLERMADEGYQGQAGDAETYLRESMVEPSAYVVEGFGKKGTNDTESPMPAVDQPPIQLSAVEMDAIIAFMQQKDGNPVTVALPSGDDAPAVESGEGAATPPALAQNAADNTALTSLDDFFDKAEELRDAGAGAKRRGSARQVRLRRLSLGAAVGVARGAESQGCR